MSNKAIDGYSYATRNKILSEMGFGNYRDYLKSELWKYLRKKTLQRNDYKCVICHQKAEYVHHHDYERTTLKHGGDGLVSICHDCHRYIEFEKDGTKTSMDRAFHRFVQRLSYKNKPRCSEVGCNRYAKYKKKGVYRCSHHREKGKGWVSINRKGKYNKKTFARKAGKKQDVLWKSKAKTCDTEGCGRKGERLHYSQSQKRKVRLCQQCSKDAAQQKRQYDNDGQLTVQELDREMNTYISLPYT